MELTLISFATMAEEGALRECLHELGHVVEAIPGLSWLDHKIHAPPHPAALFLGSANFPRERLLAALDGSVRPVGIGIFHRNTAPWDKDVLAHCTEFIGWPCEPAELSFRLERTLVDARPNPVLANANTLIEEFALLNLVGSSPAFLEALALIKKVSRCEAPALIEGETGTGKEMAARAIHYLGMRRDYPFVPVNCGAIPDNLFENELFGHERGAFTDAKEAQPGLVAQAEKGTLFLDEVDALSAKGQVVLLRFLQDQQYKPLGSRCTRQASVRVIAACNTDLEERVAAGTFRQDLLFRLKILGVTLPPLRSRVGDARLLAEHFLQRFAARHGRPAKRLHPSTLHWMQSYHWPGNVRELESFIQREFLLEEDGMIYPRVYRPSRERRHNSSDRRQQSFSLGFREAKRESIAEFEKAFLSWALEQSQGNVTRAAQRVGKERRAFGRLLKKYGIDSVPRRSDVDVKEIESSWVKFDPCMHKLKHRDSR